MYDLIFILGTPGSGKSTIGKLLEEKLNSPYIRYDSLREIHLKKDWQNHNDKERQMTYENLVFILKNYIKNDYKNIIVDGPREYNIAKLEKDFKDNNYLIITLVLSDDDVLKERVMSERSSNWREVDKSIYTNNRLKTHYKWMNEIKIDTTNQAPEETVNQIFNSIK